MKRKIAYYRPALRKKQTSEDLEKPEAYLNADRFRVNLKDWTGFKLAPPVLTGRGIA